MNARHTFAVLALAVAASALVGCGSEDGAISVTPSPTAPTDAANDALFDVKVDEAREGGYALAGLAVKATPDGKDAVTLTCTPNDANANGKLDGGETLSCVEGATNVFGKDAVGTEVDVELTASVDGKDTVVGKATWTP